MSFVDYCESRGSDRIASDLALEWATTTRSGSTHDGYLARRLISVRIFARHHQTLCRNSRRDLPNFEFRIKSVAASRSTWSSSSRHASDLRIPVTASSPIIAPVVG